MAFKTGKMIITGGDDIDTKNAFSKVSDIPGFDNLVEKGYNDCITYIENILDKPTLCLQIVDTQQPSKIARGEDGQIIAAYGWKCIQHLGQGKDGTTFWGYKYGDTEEEKHVVKVKSSYGKMFDNHSAIFNEMLRSVIQNKQHKPKALIDQVVKFHYNYYKCTEPFKSIKPNREKIHKSLRDVCDMNEWCISNTGFVLWDMGYSNGRNFMKDRKGQTRWVDYGGAGMLQCPNFKSVYEQYKGLPVLELGEESSLLKINGKDSLVIGDSDFVMCQFILNYEFWSEPDTTADLYSSILQVKRQVIPEIVELMPRLIKTKLGKKVYNEFKSSDWLDSKTWKILGKFIHENT